MQGVSIAFCVLWSPRPAKDKAPAFSTGTETPLRLASQCLSCGQSARRTWPETAGCVWPDVSAFLFQVEKACNEGVRKMSRTEQMISIQKKMEFKIKVNHASPAPPAGLGRRPLARPAEWPCLGLSMVPPPLRPSLTP